MSKVKIAARLRPRLTGELDDDAIHISNQSSITVPNPRDPTQLFNFPFTSCYGQQSSQQDIFNTDVLPMIDIVFSGVTVTIFAYGVTSSGKTHTMQGTKSDPGVIPRVVREIFTKKSTLPTSTTRLTVSYMEIYKDEVYDLFVTRENAPKLPVRENDSGQVFVANLTSIPINTVEEFDALYARATKHRSVGSTNLNHASSRSHAVLTIEATITDTSQSKTLTGKINLVDLAGSENNKLTGNDPSRMAESAAINKSLSVLGQVVHALNQGASRIPYRNSKLTRIFQDALGGSSVGLLICNLAPGIKFRQDTLNTLNFAVRTKNIENNPIVHERDTKPTARPSLVPPRASLVPQAPRTSLALASSSTLPSRVPRASTFGGATGFQSFGVLSGGGGGGRKMSLVGGGVQKDKATGGSGGGRDSTSASGSGLDKDIEERIAKLVEAEVAKRLSEERERLAKAAADQSQQSHSQQPQQPAPPEVSQHSLPAGVLTPLLKRHRDLDDELKVRLQELERKFERGSKEVQLADVLSPVSKKKTGRAYVALARAHSEKGDLQVALDLYRKAESYVPDNVKLKERIIEIEWAVKNDKQFEPSPKRPPKRRSKKAKAKRDAQMQMGGDEGCGGGGVVELDEMEVEAMIADEGQGAVQETGKGKRKQRDDHSSAPSFTFGLEVTNGLHIQEHGEDDDDDDDDEKVETPLKRQRRSAEETRHEEWAVPPVLGKKGKRGAGAA